MTRAILMCLHKYTPHGGEFYDPLLNFQLQQFKKYQDEFDMLYLVDSTWDIGSVLESWGITKVKIIKVNPSLRYYNAYKEVLPQVKEDLVLFMDDDMVVYKEGIIDETFRLIELGSFDVVSITDTIGTMKVPLKTGNKLCPYWFATRKNLLMKYLDVDWSPDSMPYTETFGLLTEAMLKDGARVYEMEDDKSGILFDGTQDGEKGKDLGYYHVRAGSTPAYLLATEKYGDRKTYEDYLKNQPKSEILRHSAWYTYMGGNPTQIILDLTGAGFEFKDYYQKFLNYHGLE